MLRFLFLRAGDRVSRYYALASSNRDRLLTRQISSFFRIKKPQRFVEVSFLERETGFEPATFSLEG